MVLNGNHLCLKVVYIKNGFTQMIAIQDNGSTEFCLFLHFFYSDIEAVLSDIAVFFSFDRYFKSTPGNLID